jgi:hypothetical protein
MVDFLVGLQLAENFDRNCRISPLDIPAFEVLLDDDVIVEVVADLLNYLVLGVDEVGNNGLLLTLVLFCGDSWELVVTIFVLLLTVVIVPH